MSVDAERRAAEEPAGAPSSSGLGERLRSLRLAARLTQTELGGDRFSKEYVSQIERGKTHPTEQATAWLAERLGVEPSFLSRGTATDARDRAEAVLARAEALVASDRHAEAIELFRAVATDAVTGAGLRARTLLGEASALAGSGDSRAAIERLLAVQDLLEGPEFDDVARADVLFRIGVCRFRLGSVPAAAGLFDEALVLAQRSGRPSELVQARILGWRSRCRRRRRDLDGAREDVERALDLARHAGDRRVAADLHYQASLDAEHTGQWIASRAYAEQARALYRELDEERKVGRLLHSLGGLALVTGEPGTAIGHLVAALDVAVESGSGADAARALATLATAHLRLEDYEAAIDHARRGLDLLEGREDNLLEIGQSNVVLGRALMERGRLAEAGECFRAADSAFEQLGSASLRAGARVALGDLASRQGDDREAARLYRGAAEALQDIRF